MSRKRKLGCLESKFHYKYIIMTIERKFIHYNTQIESSSITILKLSTYYTYTPSYLSKNWRLYDKRPHIVVQIFSSCGLHFSLKYNFIIVVIWKSNVFFLQILILTIYNFLVYFSLFVITLFPRSRLLRLIILSYAMPPLKVSSFNYIDQKFWTKTHIINSFLKWMIKLQIIVFKTN